MKNSILTIDSIALKVVLLSIGIFALKNAFSLIKTNGDPTCYLCFATEGFQTTKFFLWSLLFPLTISAFAQMIYNWGFAEYETGKKKDIIYFCLLFIGSFLLAIIFWGIVYTIFHPFGFEIINLLFWAILLADLTIISGTFFCMVILAGILTKLVG